MSEVFCETKLIPGFWVRCIGGKERIFCKKIITDFTGYTTVQYMSIHSQVGSVRTSIFSAIIRSHGKREELNVRNKPRISFPLKGYLIKVAHTCTGALCLHNG